ncbi:MAG: VacB/RNase II family 3'-5' exoribonuclease [Cellvibrio sp.]
MLNPNALQQLASLKSTIVSQKDIAQGIVRTTTKRFGFLVLDDGREAFIDPDQMQKVLPGDRVEAEISTNKKDQFEAKLTRLIETTFAQFVGKYVSKGNHFFVEPDSNNFNRWLFVPPPERKNINEGDFIHCEISRHPFDNGGKAQVRVLKRVGSIDESGIESRYAIAKFNLPNEWPAEAQAQANSIHWSPLVFENEEDLTHLPFITIDSETTRDMDDALYITATTTGWEVYSAIADPTKHIEFGSPLELAARDRVSTHYILGQALTMLPIDLSQDTYSLVAEQKRPALVCKMQIASNGEIENFSFSEAIIRSQHKLSYQGVQDALSNAENAPEFSSELLTQLQTLKAFADARASYRRANSLIMEERPDYFYMLNEQKKIDRIERRDRTTAHRLVEEAMLATNICAGDFFVANPGYGIFSTHIGFRQERINDALSLLTEDRPDLNTGDLTELGNFLKLFRELRLNNQDPINSGLHSLLQRQLQAGELSFEPIPHFGLGFNAYAMMTSPIRRYNDFFNHLAIKRILRGEPPLEIADKTALINHLQERLTAGRQACRFTETWLAAQYMANQIGSVHTGQITLVTSIGIGVKLEDWGMDGFVTLAPRGGEVKAQFDSRRLTLTVEGVVYKIDQTVQVIIDEVDVEKHRASFSIVDDATAERLRAWM